MTYKLKTLTISGVHNKGTYGFDDSTWKSQEGTATYAHTIDGGALEVNTTGVEVNTAWMLMPQTWIRTPKSMLSMTSMRKTSS